MDEVEGGAARLGEVVVKGRVVGRGTAEREDEEGRASDVVASDDRQEVDRDAALRALSACSGAFIVCY